MVFPNENRDDVLAAGCGSVLPPNENVEDGVCFAGALSTLLFCPKEKRLGTAWVLVFTDGDSNENGFVPIVNKRILNIITYINNFCD